MFKLTFTQLTVWERFSGWISSQLDWNNLKLFMQQQNQPSVCREQKHHRGSQRRNQIAWVCRVSGHLLSVMFWFVGCCACQSLPRCPARQARDWCHGRTSFLKPCAVSWAERQHLQFLFSTMIQKISDLKMYFYGFDDIQYM